MERNEYLQMCQRCSLFNTGILGIKENVPDELKVIHNGVIYYPIAYELSFLKGNVTHTAILQDIKSNSIVHAELSKVDKVFKL